MNHKRFPINLKLTKGRAEIFFIMLLIIVSWFYNYHEMVFMRPQSIHKWRQTDCASLALNYYQGGMHFFNPETHNLTSEGGTSGKAFTSEIPFLYYGMAILYKLFGPHEYIYRLLNTLLFWIGLFFLYKTFRLISNSFVWSVLLSLIFFTSPVLVYYGNNFLTNSTELAFSFMGWYFFILFIKKREARWFFTSMLIFFLAASMKITAFLSFFAIGFTLLLEMSGIVKIGGNEKLYRKPLTSLLTMISVFLVVTGWILFAHFSNKTNGCTYFSTVIFPIWNLDKSKITDILLSIRSLWLFDYFHLSLFLFMGIVVGFVLLQFRKLSLFWRWVLPFVAFEAIVYIVLQFRTFADHDYYTIGLYIVPALFLMAAAQLICEHYPRFYHSWLLKVMGGILILFNMVYTNSRLEYRYGPVRNDFQAFKDIYALEPFLRTKGLEPFDTVISIPDRSHATLYLMNQKGWTEYTDASFNRGEWIFYNNDSAAVQRSIDRGARYMVVNGIGQLYEKTYLQSFCRHLLGRYQNVLLFDLRSQQNNFSIREKEVKKRYFCDAETVSDDGYFFSGEGSLFEYAKTKSDVEKISGSFSSCLSGGSPYGMTLKVSDQVMGESFRLTAWRKQGAGAAGEIVVQVSGQIFTSKEPVETRPDGWEKIEIILHVDEAMEDKEFVMFLHNPFKIKAFFDDFEIIQYRSVYERE